MGIWRLHLPTKTKRVDGSMAPLPVLFMSAFTGEEVVQRGLIASDAPFIQKPFTAQALIERSRSLARVR